MQIERTAVVLRPRSPWEAMELGSALVRRNAGAVWKPWLALTLPVFAVVNVLGWIFDHAWWALFAMWWLKPLFDRIVLHVLSRAVFGDVPGARETLRAQRRWGLPRPMLDHLLWRRLSPARSLYLPVDLLEGGDAKQRSERRRVIGARASGHAAALTLVCMNFEVALMLAPVLFVMMFIPPELLPQTWAGAMQTMQGGFTPGMALAYNALAWLATTLVEPFYIGAGFGLYLNRRTELEAWDVEIALRRMRARLQRLAGAAMVVACIAFAPRLLHAQGNTQANRQNNTVHGQAANPQNAIHGQANAGQQKLVPAQSLEAAIGPLQPQQQSLRDAMVKLKDDPELHPREQITRWEPIRKPTPQTASKWSLPSWLGMFARGLGTVGQVIAWAVVAAIVGLLAWWLVRTLPQWRGGSARRRASDIAIVDIAPPEALPDDIPTAVRRLWASGDRRQALALLYRAGVESMVARTQVLLVPGATEAECLRASTQLPGDEERTQFRTLVRMWQYAAYAHRLPDDAEFDGLLSGLAHSFGWSR
ncbi:DUF4129 domain-containing protein [Solilutibacter silvestris]|uniref:DUF4129 domain-containing protein n=1 Tax=Solilutibacter silvestris TaxID=1645665 RepID=A0A2K1Q0N2_9GAMM|nr:DUF4129 domain-containing protein [Lysobacter silvestris]PNS08596.1 hypothetical protein Lysil_0225 [Lysobacter silvestris]